VLVVGPRKLPADGQVTVWVDAGSGPGYEIAVPVRDLAPVEDNHGDEAARTYQVAVRECEG
jgi:hypothetical protein